MVLLDGYIRTLRLFLPKDQRDDIIRELSEEIESQAADKEAELGRPLSMDDEAALIGQFGHPLLTAARYRPQRHLVGPVVFPYYWLLLKVIVSLVIAGHVIGSGVLLAGAAGWSEIGSLTLQLVGDVLKIVGWFTLLAAFAELSLAKSGVLEKWNPRTLISQPSKRRVHAEKNVQQTTQAIRRHRPLLWPGRMTPSSAAAPSVSGFVVRVVLGIWWLLALKCPYLMFGGGADIVAWGPAMNRVYTVLAVAQITALLQHFARLTQPHTDRLFQVARVVWAVNGALFLYLVLTSDHQWVVWNGAAEARARSTAVAEVVGRELSLVDLVNYAFSIPFTLAAIFGVVGTLRALFRWFVGNRPSAVHV